MIFFFGVDAPDNLFVMASRSYCADGFDCSEHRVVHVVVSVLTVASEAPEIVYRIKKALYLVKLGIGSEICGVRLLHSDSDSVKYIVTVDNIYFY